FEYYHRSFSIGSKDFEHLSTRKLDLKNDFQEPVKSKTSWGSLKTSVADLVLDPVVFAQRISKIRKKKRWIQIPIGVYPDEAGQPYVGEKGPEGANTKPSQLAGVSRRTPSIGVLTRLSSSSSQPPRNYSSFRSHFVSVFSAPSDNP
ncbi:hypothetical protein HAX54_001727, partial [Datura stramonium]|nr:hypothetical protein [Datura stramonium]